jgi:hypothetical protein
MSADWTDVLDELERQVTHAERLSPASGEQIAAWEPPTVLGPLPPDLVARAQALAERQRSVIERLAPLMAATRQQLEVGRRIGDATARPAGPVYVDVTA